DHRAHRELHRAARRALVEVLGARPEHVGWKRAVVGRPLARERRPAAKRRERGRERQERIGRFVAAGAARRQHSEQGGQRAHHSSTNCGKPSSLATLFISNTTEPSWLGSDDSWTDFHSVPNGVARFAVGCWSE